MRLHQPAGEFWTSTPKRVDAFFHEAHVQQQTEDARAGIITAVIANQNRRAGMRAYQPGDFFPSLKRQSRGDATPDEMRLRVLQFFGVTEAA